MNGSITCLKKKEFFWKLFDDLDLIWYCILQTLLYFEGNNNVNDLIIKINCLIALVKIF